MKYQFMQAHQQEFSLKRMSKVLQVSRSGYYRFIHASPAKRTIENQHLYACIKTSYTASRHTYGSPRIHADLKAQEIFCSRKRVAKLMRANGLQAKMKKRFKVTTQSNPKAVAAPNLLAQDFTAQAPNTRWVTDITYVFTEEGWLYVAAILDLFSRCIVGLAMGARMTTDLVLNALDQAVLHRQPKPGLVHHSDKGSQYTSQPFQQQLSAYGIVTSMSGAGNCFDNAAMESFFHTLKTEHIYFERYATRKEAAKSIFEWIEVFYNRKRRHSTIGYMSPLAFEENWHQQQTVSLRSVH